MAEMADNSNNSSNSQVIVKTLNSTCIHYATNTKKEGGRKEPMRGQRWPTVNSQRDGRSVRGTATSKKEGGFQNGKGFQCETGSDFQNENYRGFQGENGSDFRN